MGFLPHYTHIVNPKLKHIYLSIDDKGNLIIKSPKVSQKKIEQLLLKKASWINKSREKVQQKKGKTVDFTQKSELYFLGESHPFYLNEHTKKRTELHFDGDVFRLNYHHYDEKLFLKKIDLFYKKEAQTYITPLLNKWSDKMNLPVNTLSFRKTKRQWGSCSAKNDISINTMVMKLPLKVIEYIVVHELAHVKHKHHQKAFWSLVEEYLPDYKTSVKELKNYTT
ncbi:MAG: M48 family metallopeptidase [Sulfurovum sp.]|nr:M48 family metallopeptidase [Sulfurovum sp.]